MTVRSSYVCLDGDTFLSLGHSIGTYRIVAHAGGNDECLGIVYHKGCKCVCRTLHDGFFALEPDETLDVDITPLAPVREAAFRKALRVRSLWDLAFGEPRKGR